MNKRILRIVAVRNDKLGGISTATFMRRYRFNPAFPEPLNLPDGQLGYWEHEIDAYLDALGRTSSPRGGDKPFPAHWSRPWNAAAAADKEVAGR